MVIYISRFNKASLNIERCFSASCMADSAEIQYKALNFSRVVLSVYITIVTSEECWLSRPAVSMVVTTK